MRDIINLCETILVGQHKNPDGTTLIYHWTNVGVAKKYLKTGMMLPKWKHRIPDRGTIKGISFAYDYRTWWTREGDRVCFVFDRSKIPNEILDIPGQAVYDYQQYGGASDQMMCGNIERASPDEAFLLGSLNLSSLVKVIVPGAYEGIEFEKLATARGIQVEKISDSYHKSEKQQKAERKSLKPAEAREKLLQLAVKKYNNRSEAEIRQRLDQMTDDQIYDTLDDLQ